MTIAALIAAPALLLAAQGAPTASETVRFEYSSEELADRAALEARIRSAARAACETSAMVPAANRIGCRREVTRELMRKVERKAG